MQEHSFSCVVIADGSALEGIITERDLVRIMSDLSKKPHLLQLKGVDLMSTAPVTVSEDTTLSEALAISQTGNVRHLPVINSQKVLSGIVTYTDLVRAQIDISEKAVALRTTELEAEIAQLKALSLEDPLLGIGNRRAMEVDLDYIHKFSIRHRRPYSVVLFDVDHFKSYNDHYGHSGGDQILQQVASHIRFSVRKSDRLYRFGGEEMLLVLPETDKEGAYVMADRLVKEIADQNIPHQKSPYTIITVSAGVAFEDPEAAQSRAWQEHVEKADRGLYLAKDNGRNQVAICATDI